MITFISYINHGSHKSKGDLGKARGLELEVTVRCDGMLAKQSEENTNWEPEDLGSRPASAGH